MCIQTYLHELINNGGQEWRSRTVVENGGQEWPIVRCCQDDTVHNTPAHWQSESVTCATVGQTGWSQQDLSTDELPIW